MKKLFVDSDIILDLLAERQPFYKSAADFFTYAYQNKFILYTTAVIFANVFYILRKIIGNDAAKQKLKDLRLIVHILPIDENIMDMALNSNFTDYEDSLEYFTARENSLFALITRNIRDYKVDDIVIQTAEDYIISNKEYLENSNGNN
jgi:predicted nucleic acid-binding protein